MQQLGKPKNSWSSLKPHLLGWLVRTKKRNIGDVGEKIERTFFRLVSLSSPQVCRDLFNLILMESSEIMRCLRPPFSFLRFFPITFLRRSISLTEVDTGKKKDKNGDNFSFPLFFEEKVGAVFHSLAPPTFLN